MPVNTLQGLNAQSITPDDSNDITLGGTAIDGLDNGVCPYVGTTGDVKVTMVGGQVVTFTNVQGGTFMPIQIKKLWSSDTTASDFVALY
jgi:hypothetical protein